MHLSPTPPINRNPSDAIAASLRGWLVLLMAWFCEVLDRLPPEVLNHPLFREARAIGKARLAADLRCAVRDLGHHLILHAGPRVRLARWRQRARLYINATPAGLRSAKRLGRVTRLFTRPALAGFNSGTLRQRAERLATALANLEPLIARVAKRMEAIWRYQRAPALILTASRDACVSRAEPLAPACADTS
jgi:hypothetical protein